jgi:CRP/FNR family transcriptional regulator
MDNVKTDPFCFFAPMPGLTPLPDAKAPVADNPRTPCDSCGARKICQAAQLGCGAPHPITFHVGTRKVRAGEAVFRVGDPFRNLYIPRAGTCKSIRLHRDGRQQITAFHLGGECLGMDAIASGRHQTEAVALEDMMVCVLPYHDIEALADDISDVRRGLERMLSGEIVREAGLLMLMGHLSAEERVAAFLVDLAERYAARGYSPVAFNLRMSREEIGSHLGMKLETVSRMFSRLQQRGLIALHGKEVHILDMAGLRTV